MVSYPTWSGPLEEYHYDNFNVFLHFSMVPNDDGSLNWEYIENSQNAIDAVNEAHAHDDLMLLVIGGWGYGPNFNSATSTETKRNRLVSEIKNRVETLGYDGITWDWEDEVNNANYVKTVKLLRQELGNKWIQIDVCCDITTDTMVELVPYVDTIAMMTYEEPMANYFYEIRDAGVPANKLIGGLGFWSEAYAINEERVRSEVQFVIDNGLAGIEIWEHGEIGPNDARANAINEMLGTGNSCSGNNQEQDCQDGETKCENKDYYTCSSYKWVNNNRIAGKCGVECLVPENKCVGTEYFECVNYEWISAGEVSGHCGYQEESECSGIDTKCEGHIYYTCSNEEWVSQGFIDGKCGYTESSSSSSSSSSSGSGNVEIPSFELNTILFSFQGFDITILIVLIAFGGLILIKLIT
jgi:hypothetical protein